MKAYLLPAYSLVPCCALLQTLRQQTQRLPQPQRQEEGLAAAGLPRRQQQQQWGPPSLAAPPGPRPERAMPQLPTLTLQLPGRLQGLPRQLLLGRVQQAPRRDQQGPGVASRAQGQPVLTLLPSQPIAMLPQQAARSWTLLPSCRC